MTTMSPLSAGLLEFVRRYDALVYLFTDKIVATVLGYEYPVAPMVLPYSAAIESDLIAARITTYDQYEDAPAVFEGFVL